jgi:cytochrome c oxidase subunit 2
LTESGGPQLQITLKARQLEMDVMKQPFHFSAAAKSGNQRSNAALLPVAASFLANRTEAAQTAEAPLNYFMRSYGPAAEPTMYLGWVLAGLSVTIILIISLLLISALLRNRSPADAQTLGAESGGLRWIYIGTGISTVVLFGLVIYSLVVLDAVAKPSSAPALTVAVTAYDWWWRIEYEHDDLEEAVTTANELHIPVGKPVLVKLKSADVIHAFWVPTLAGKTQAIPGLINQQWIQADSPGVYTGQCAQFCGVGHAHMNFEVVAESAEDFEKWRNSQRSAALTPPASAAINFGQKLFMDRCAGCHAIRGTDAAGQHAPDLTHLNSRRRLAAGLLPNTPDNLMNWIVNAQQLKPGSRMPSIALSETEKLALSTYLSTLD